VPLILILGVLQVKWSVYKHYLMSVGVLASAVTVVMNLVLQVFQVGSNYWLAEWSNDETMVRTLPSTITVSREINCCRLFDTGFPSG
jgi:hypothetical protein